MIISRPHDPEARRDVQLTVEELLEPIPVSPRPAPEPRDFFQYQTGSSTLDDSLYASRDEALSKTSALNRRRTVADDPALAQDSILNVRYTKRQAPQPPRSPDSTRPVSPVPPLQLQSLASGSPRQQQSPPSSPPLSPTSKLNQRYGSMEMPQPTGQGRLAGSKLNSRYNEPSKSNVRTPNGHIPNGHMSNGHVENGDFDLSSDSQLNRR